MANLLIVEEEKTMVLKISQMASKFISLSAQYNNKALYLSRKYFIFMTESNHTTPSKTLVWLSFSPISSSLIRPL